MKQICALRVLTILMVIGMIIRCENSPTNPKNNVPQTPSLSSPTSGTQNVPLTPTLSWNSVNGAFAYQVQVASDSTFSNGKLMFNDSSITENSIALKNQLSPSTKYFWRVYAKNSGGKSQASSVWSFATLAVEDPIPGTVILSEGFEGNLEKYNQITYHDEDGKMSISTMYAHSGKGSLTSDSNYTGIKTRIDPALDDSIAGVQFYLMATKASQTNLLVAICKPGSSASGLFTTIGMGIDKSDSLKYVYESAPGDSAGSVYKNFAALTLNKWYKCKIEYDFPNSNLTFYLDDEIVHQQKTENPLFLSYFAAMRDGLGAKGPSGYYIDDLAIYNYKK